MLASSWQLVRQGLLRATLLHWPSQNPFEVNPTSAGQYAVRDCDTYDQKI